MKKPNTPFHVLAPFTIKAATTPPNGETADAGDSEVIKISGYANFSGLVEEGTVFIDLVGDVVVPSGIDVNVWKKNPQVLLQHMRDCTIGRGLSVVKKKDGLFIEAEIHKGAMSDEDFYRVKSGLLCFFSIGFRTMAGEYKKVGDRQVYFITKSLLLEVSVVGIPANGESSFQVIKSLGEDSDGFYSGDLGTAPPAPDEGTKNEGAQMSIKAPWRELLLADKVKEMEALGMTTELDVEKEISVADFRALVVAQVLADISAAKAAADLVTAEAAAAVETGRLAAEALAAEEATKAAELAATEAAALEAAELETAKAAIETMRAEIAALTKQLAD